MFTRIFPRTRGSRGSVAGLSESKVRTRSIMRGILSCPVNTGIGVAKYLERLRKSA